MHCALIRVKQHIISCVADAWFQGSAAYASLFYISNARTNFRTNSAIIYINREIDLSEVRETFVLGTGLLIGKISKGL